MAFVYSVYVCILLLIRHVQLVGSPSHRCLDDIVRTSSVSLYVHLHVVVAPCSSFPSAQLKKNNNNKKRMGRGYGTGGTSSSGTNGSSDHDTHGSSGNDGSSDK